MEKTPRWLWQTLIGIVIALCVVGFLWKKQNTTITAPKIQLKTEKFTLPPKEALNSECEEIPTVDVGPGTIHRLRGDAPYRVISGKPDGTSKIYNMAAGWSTWTGSAPAGKLYLMSAKDVESPTLVEIVRVQ